MFKWLVWYYCDFEMCIMEDIKWEWLVGLNGSRVILVIYIGCYVNRVNLI